MSKKIIAILTIATLLFVGVFAACEKKNSDYTNLEDYDLVTDENGEKILAEDGQLLVYETDEKGKYVTDESGERVTQVRQFQPIEKDGVVEDYGFKLILPEGWKTTAEFGVFESKDAGLSCQISIVKYFYADYYNMNLDFYNRLKDEGINVTWEEDVDFGKEFKGVCRFMMETDEGIAVLYFFENFGNVYKVLFSGTDSDTIIADTEEFCKSMSFKSFTYYNDITKSSEEDITDKTDKTEKTTE